jgi:hypothetical protein
MLIPLNSSKASNETHIFTGYFIPCHQFPTVSLKLSPPIQAILMPNGYFIGVSLVSVRGNANPNWASSVEFSMDLLRDWSTNDNVRLVRKTLMELFPERFKDVYPKLFIVTF